MNDKLDFIINKDKKTITCIATNCTYDVLNDLTKRLSTIQDDIIRTIYYDLANSDSSDLRINDKFYGTAKCVDPDVFDIEYGKKLAIKKMRYKYNKAKKKVMNRYTKRYEILFNIFNDMSNWYNSRVDTSEENLKFFIK